MPTIREIRESLQAKLQALGIDDAEVFQMHCEAVCALALDDADALIVRNDAKHTLLAERFFAGVETEYAEEIAMVQDLLRSMVAQAKRGFLDRERFCAEVREIKRAMATPCLSRLP